MPLSHSKDKFMDLLKRSSYFYNLPQELIAQTPSEKRDHSRLLCLDKQSGETNHKNFFEIIDSLQKGDCLVINDTKVIPARLFGKAEGRSGEIETVLLSRMEDAEGEVWKCLTRPGKKTKIGAKIVYSDELCGVVTDVLDGGIRVIKFEYEGVFNEILDRIGIMPLPPYITEKLQDKNRYQTVYAKTDGSAAAPTEGLHFTPELLKRQKKRALQSLEFCFMWGLARSVPLKRMTFPTTQCTPNISR